MISRKFASQIVKLKPRFCSFVLLPNVDNYAIRPQISRSDIVVFINYLDRNIRFLTVMITTQIAFVI